MLEQPMTQFYFPESTLQLQIFVSVEGCTVNNPLITNKAKRYFKMFKTINELCLNDKMTMYGYKKLSQIYQNMGEYDNAIKWCKKLLMIAIITNDRPAELETYDMMSKWFRVFTLFG